MIGNEMKNACKYLLIGGRVWSEDHTFSANCPILIEGEKIVGVGKECPRPADARVIDLAGKIVIPGLVDVHTHGRIGGDFVSADEGKLVEMKKDYARTGVTTVFATLASATPEEWHRAIGRIQACGFDGIHFEGRYLNPKKRGAHRADQLAPLDAADLETYLREVKIPCHITAAFELDPDGSFAKTGLDHGATLGIGHTDATAAETKTALSRGVTSFTHLFNAMPPLHHREGGAVSVALNGDGYAEMIVDGIHICPDMVRLAYRCLGADRLVLITDSMEATGYPDGRYTLCGQTVIVKDGKALNEEGVLSGSTLNLLDGLKNLVAFAGADLADAVACATINPAREVGIDRVVGSIEVGKRADLLILDEEMNLSSVIWHGAQI